MFSFGGNSVCIMRRFRWGRRARISLWLLTLGAICFGCLVIASNARLRLLEVMDLYVPYSFFLLFLYQLWICMFLILSFCSLSLSISVMDLYVPYSLFLFSLYLCFLFLTFCSLHLLYYYRCCCCCSLLSFCEDIISRYRCPYSLHYDVGDFLDEV